MTIPLLARRIALGAAFLAYSVLVYLCALRHQPWFDEAQSWLLARDLNLGQLVFHQMRYEGSPALWPALLMLLQKLGLPYGHLNLVSASIGVLGIALFLWLSPFPLAFKVLFPFCYFPLFQFSVIARSYVLYLPLLCLIAHLYHRRLSHRLAYWLLLALLANVSLHGALVAGVLFADCIWVWSRNARRDWKFWTFVSASGVLYTLLFLQLRFPPDLLTQLTPVSATTRLLRMCQQMREAFFGGIGGNLNKIVGLAGAVAVIAVSARWFQRAGRLWLFAGLLAPLLLLALVRATYWHAGVIFLIWLFTLWISFENRPGFEGTLKIAIAAVFAVQITFGLESVRFQLTHVFSGSKAAAVYLASAGAGTRPQNLFAVAPESFAVQPYFHRNLFALQESGRLPAFYPWTKSLDHEGLTDIDRQRPDRVVLRYGSPSSAGTLHDLWGFGYCEEQRFPGSIWWKNAELEPDTFIILSRCKWR